MDKDTVVTLLKYKRWIDLATLQAIRAIDGTVHGEKRHLTIRLMNHIHVVDMIFRANLRGRPHGYTALNTPETPTVDELETAMTACTDEYIQYVSAMTPADFHERIAFKFVDGGDGNMTAMEMLNHMLFHGAYHRGAVGWMIGECGGVPPKEVLTVSCATIIPDRAKPFTVDYAENQQELCLMSSMGFLVQGAKVGSDRGDRYAQI